MKKHKKVDWNLKFIRDIFGLESLHFGYWDNFKEEVNINLHRVDILMF
jgi:hypothetical protein